MRTSSISDCKIIKLPRINTLAGSITGINDGVEVPFACKRIFYIYDIPSGEDRGAHGHKECHQLLVAITGAFEVEIFDGKNKQMILLNQPDIGLHIPPGIWASEVDFSGGAICLVLASQEYDESDYIRDINDFYQYKNDTLK